MDIRHVICAPLYLSLTVLPLFMHGPGVVVAQEAAADSAGVSLDELMADTARAIDRASSAGCLWRDTESIYSRAQDVAREDDTVKARRLARRAGQQARLALSQCRLEHAHYQIGRMDPAQLDAAHRALYRRLQDAIRQHDAETASRLLEALTEGAEP